MDDKIKAKLETMKEGILLVCNFDILDYTNEWWKATEIDNYSVKDKLLRVG